MSLKMRNNNRHQDSKFWDGSFHGRLFFSVLSFSKYCNSLTVASYLQIPSRLHNALYVHGFPLQNLVLFNVLQLAANANAPCLMNL